MWQNILYECQTVQILIRHCVLWICSAQFAQVCLFKYLQYIRWFYLWNQYCVVAYYLYYAKKNYIWKCHLFMSNVAFSCKLFKHTFCIKANSMDPDQTASRGAVWSGSTLFAIMMFKVAGRRQSRRQLLCLTSKGLIISFGFSVLFFIIVLTVYVCIWVQFYPGKEQSAKDFRTDCVDFPWPLHYF